MRDDSAATKRKGLLKSRINEAYVRYLAIKMLKLPKRNVIFIFRPIILGLCPNFVYERLHKKKLRNLIKEKNSDYISLKFVFVCICAGGMCKANNGLVSTRRKVSKNL